jgi:hypothetical protein
LIPCISYPGLQAEQFNGIAAFGWQFDDLFGIEGIAQRCIGRVNHWDGGAVNGDGFRQRADRQLNIEGAGCSYQQDYVRLRDGLKSCGRCRQGVSGGRELQGFLEARGTRSDLQAQTACRALQHQSRSGDCGTLRLGDCAPQGSPALLGLDHRQAENCLKWGHKQ